jgi:serine/threonine kinase 32
MGACFSKEPLPEDELDLRHFKLLRNIGKGAFGKVKVVEKKSSGKLYALKYMSKEKIIEKKAVMNVLKERKLLQNLAFYPFLVNLCYAFQDDTNLYMVIDLMLGGDLRYYLNHHPKPMAERLLVFWMAESALGINYMHYKSAVHRDLKPDNLLIDSDGHIHLTDLNLTTYLPQDGKLLTSRCGTLYYMAPEVVCGEGYNAMVDWWSLGVIMYECMFGAKPFRGKTKEDVVKAVQRGTFAIPPRHHYSAECVDFLKRLLRSDPRQRMCGSAEGFLELTGHPLFKEIDWRKLEKLELPSPFIPNTARANFETRADIEELFETNAADLLKYRKRRLIQPDHMSPLQLKMENDYADFNYERFKEIYDRAKRLSIIDTLNLEEGGQEDVLFVPEEDTLSNGT